jgi:hypothetical protein
MGILAALAVSLAGCPSTHVVPDAPELDVPALPDAPDAPICTAEVCDGTDGDCDGRVDEEASCTLYGAESRCTLGRCELVGCLSGFADCDGDPTNGCELDTRSNRAHCGACDFECAVTQTCERSACRRERIVDVAPGDRGTCVLLESGRVLCWGSNESGLFWDDLENAAEIIDLMENPWYFVHDVGELLGEDLPMPCMDIMGCGRGGAA